MSFSRRAAALGLVVVAFAAGTAVRVATPRFLPDDPLQVDDDRAIDASGVATIKGSNGYDFAEHTFGKPGDRRDVRAANVNTIDEVPDSSWFTNRIGRREMSIDEIVKGPNLLETINIDGWPIVEEKSSGITPGYRVTDPTGHLYQVKFDPPEHPEMASAAEVIGAAIYHAVGYNVVQGYAIDVDPARIVISEKATTVDLSGRRRQMRREDVDRLLARGARLPNGKYRATLSRFAEGRPVGYFKYYGTRPDDPNDIHPHEHRRELRANRVFGAWLNHDDSRGINSLDMLDGPDGRKHIVHYMFDFGSTMGSGSTVAQVPRAGNEYIVEWGPAFKTLATLGLWVRPWILVDYWEEAKAVGRFEADFFDPVEVASRIPQPGVRQPGRRRRLLGRAPGGEVLRSGGARRRRQGALQRAGCRRTHRLDADQAPGQGPADVADGGQSNRGTDACGGRHADVSQRCRQCRCGCQPMASYVLRWSSWDNVTGTASGKVQEQTVAATESRVSQKAPSGVLTATDYVQVAIETNAAGFPAWRTPVTLTFRRSGGRWQHVGLDRRP